MAVRGRDDEKPFLSRWSQRKRQAEEATRETQAPAASEAEPVAEPEEIDPAELPDIDSLGAESDFSVFMRKGVPSALKQRALRRLWQVDPAFRHICMLDDYNQDFTDAAMVVPNLKTIYQVGRGMVLSEEDAKQAVRAETTATALPAADPTSMPGDSAAADEPAGEESNETAALQTADPARAQEEAEATAEALPDGAPRQQSVPAAPGTGSARRRRWGDVEV